MKFFTSILTALAVLPVLAQSSSSTAALALLQKELPKCALSCMMEAIPKSTCGLTNATCICTNKPLNAELSVCVAGNCTIPEGLIMKNVSLAMCGSPVRDDRETPYVIAIVSSAVAILFVLLRMYLIFTPGGKNPYWDDAMIIVCLGCALIPGGLAHTLKENGLGRDLWYLTPTQITNMLRAYFIGEIAYIEGMGLLKIAILWLFLVIFPEKQFRQYVYITMGLCVAYCISFFFATLFQCSPVSYTWTQWDGLHEGKCNDIHLQAWLSAIVNIILDVIVMVLPLRNISKLSMNWKKKSAVMSMFLVGSVVLVVSIVRLQSLIHFSKSKNISWDYVPATYWSIVELDLGVVCACMPAVRGLYMRFQGAKNKGGSNAGYGYSYGSSASRSQRSEKVFSRKQADPSISTSDFIPLTDYESENKEARSTAKLVGPPDV